VVLTGTEKEIDETFNYMQKARGEPNKKVRSMKYEWNQFRKCHRRSK